MFINDKAFYLYTKTIVWWIFVFGCVVIGIRNNWPVLIYLCKVPKEVVDGLQVLVS